VLRSLDPNRWSADLSWKDKVFTREQPFVDPDESRRSLERKEQYRSLRRSGAL